MEYNVNAVRAQYSFRSKFKIKLLKSRRNSTLERIQQRYSIRDCNIMINKSGKNKYKNLEFTK